MEERSLHESFARPPADVRELRVGIVGTGFIGRVHARAARVAGAQLAGVASSTPAHAATARRELGAERAYDSAEALIASDAIDVVHICTPNHLHVPLAGAAIAAGKHVVCEKPVALDSGAAEELLSAAEAAGVLVTVPFAYRYYPTVREARERVRSAAGDARLIHGAYLQDWLLDVGDYNWRVEAELGGRSRAFADIGSHWCDLVEFVSGQRIAALVARTTIAHSRRRQSSSPAFERGEGGGEVRTVDTEDAALVLFETDAGASGSVVVSQVSAGRKNQLRFEISTDSETFAFDQEHPDSLAVLRRQGAELVPRDFGTLSPAAAAYVTLPGGHPQGYHDCFDAFTAETYAAIAGAEPEGLPQLRDGLRAVRVTEAVLESERQGSWVEVEAG
jgi:predicted dehydrogenase